MRGICGENASARFSSLFLHSWDTFPSFLQEKSVLRTIAIRTYYCKFRLNCKRSRFVVLYLVTTRHGLLGAREETPQTFIGPWLGQKWKRLLLLAASASTFIPTSAVGYLYQPDSVLPRSIQRNLSLLNSVISLTPLHNNHRRDTNPQIPGEKHVVSWHEKVREPANLLHVVNEMSTFVKRGGYYPSHVFTTLSPYTCWLFHNNKRTEFVALDSRKRAHYHPTNPKQVSQTSC